MRRPYLDCGALSSGSRCPAHTQARERARDQRRGTSTQRGYTSAWQRLAAQAIERQPWCTDCGSAGTPDNPLTGDHLRWPAHTIDDIDVVCRVHNSQRGSLRGRPRRHTWTTEDAS
jgi:hypothetical protein